MDERTLTTIGFDIGGANLKIASSSGHAVSQPFALWKSPDRLSSELKNLLTKLRRAPNGREQIAVTMTGELADCYRSKQEGVSHIVDSTCKSFPDCEISFYLVDGSFVSASIAKEKYQLAAASNWHALASLVAQQNPSQTGILVDLGSTTCDVIPFCGGSPTANGSTDLTRMLASELIYTGVARSPICAVLPEFEFRGQTIGVAQEWFATMSDVYLFLEDIEERPERTDTADGRSMTFANSARRLRRMFCADESEVSHDELVEFCNTAKQFQIDRIVSAIEVVARRQTDPVQTIFVSGEGEFLCHQLLDAQNRNSHSVLHRAEVVSLSQGWGDSICACSPAYAVSCLYEQSSIRSAQNPTII